MAIRNPIVLINGRPKSMPVGDSFPASLTPAHMIDIIGFQFTPITTTVTTDTLIAGSDFLWNTVYDAAGQSVYLETVGYGSAATTTTTVTLYTLAGVAVTGSATTAASVTANRARSAALGLVDGTTYQVRWKSNAATGNLKSVRLVIM